MAQIARQKVEAALAKAALRHEVEVLTANDGDPLALRMNPDLLPALMLHLGAALGSDLRTDLAAALTQQDQRDTGIYPEGLRAVFSWPKVKVTRG